MEDNKTIHHSEVDNVCPTCGQNPCVGGAGHEAYVRPEVKECEPTRINFDKDDDEALFNDDYLDTETESRGNKGRGKRGYKV